MKHTKVLIISIFITVLVAGCMGPVPIRPASGPDASVAYGNITIPNQHITNVMLYKVGEVYAPPFKSPPRGHAYQNGNFFFENLEPGKYFLVGFMSGNDAFYFNYKGVEEEKFLNEIAIDIKPGTVNYVGSYKVTGIEQNFIKTDTFDIKPSETPTRSTILLHLKDAAKGTGWGRRFASAMSTK